jgi:hypothetical protein
LRDVSGARSYSVALPLQPLHSLASATCGDGARRYSATRQRRALAALAARKDAHRARRAAAAARAEPPAASRRQAPRSARLRPPRCPCWHAIGERRPGGRVGERERHVNEPSAGHCLCSRPTRGDAAMTSSRHLGTCASTALRYLSGSRSARGQELAAGAQHGASARPAAAFGSERFSLTA